MFKCEMEIHEIGENQSFMRNFVKYLRKSTLHGLTYVGDSLLHWCERLIQKIKFMVSMVKFVSFQIIFFAGVLFGIFIINLFHIRHLANMVDISAYNNTRSSCYCHNRNTVSCNHHLQHEPSEADRHQ